MKKRYEIVILALGEMLLNQAERGLIKDYEIESLKAKIAQLEKTAEEDKAKDKS